MKEYTLWQTVIVRQYKKVMAPVDADVDNIIEESWDIPWINAKVINSEGIEVED